MTKKSPYKRTKLIFTEPSKAINSQAYETDINNMVMGLTPFTQSRRPAYYIDETILPASYEEQFNAVLAAQEAFMMLPPEVRERFDNDPAELSKALGNPALQKELEELGVIGPTPTPVPPAKPIPDVSDETADKDGE